jgi:hypothetical protein
MVRFCIRFAVVFSDEEWKMSRTLLTRRRALAGAASVAVVGSLARRARAQPPNVIFDSMGAQVQVQNQTLDRLTTWTNALGNLYAVNYTDYTQPIAPQLAGQDVFIVTTHQYTSVPADSTPPPVNPNPIPANYNFAYSSSDLGGILQWVEAGGGLLLFVNHSDFPTTQGPDPYWPIYDVQLTAALGITTVFAAIALSGSTMKPNPEAPEQIIGKVAGIQALDSGGIVVGGGPNITTSTVLVPLPRSWTDSGPLQYQRTDLAFAVLYTVGAGNVIVIGHSGIAGNAGTEWPSQGQIGAASNFRFLMNCVAYLAAGAQTAN